MVLPAQFKSRTFRRVKRVTPGHNVVIHYVKPKPAKATCPIYGTELHGVPRGSPTEMKNMPKSSKRPERPFGGILSSKALRDVMKQKARETKL
jgi:large subunit ribosomal protein L34e